MKSRQAMKILHEVGSAGVIGAIVTELVLAFAADIHDRAGYAAMRHAIDLVSRRVLLPSLCLMLVSGLLALAIHPPFHNAGWAWIKALTGVSMLEGTLGGIVGPAREAAALSAKVLAGEADPDALEPVLRHEHGALWVILALSVANVILGVWRPKLRSKPLRLG